MTRYFIAPDGHNEPTVWERTDREEFPEALLRRCDIDHAGRDGLWRVIVAGLNPGAIWEQGRAAGAALFPAQADENPHPTQPFRCAICGDDSEPAECPDRHGWEDHGLCCMGSCAACQHRLDQGEA